MEEVKPTKFQSPLPFLIQFRNLIFGKEKPDVYTRITFMMNVIIWLTFFVWNGISYFTITSRSLIYRMKGIPVESIIQKRGVELGYEGSEFLNRLLTFHGIALICWGIIFIGLVLLYRKNKHYTYFILIPFIFYLGMTVFYIGFTYFMEDTTTYDKIALLIFTVSILIHSYLVKNEREGGSINFFGEVEEEA